MWKGKRANGKGKGESNTKVGAKDYKGRIRKIFRFKCMFMLMVMFMYRYKNVSNM